MTCSFTPLKFGFKHRLDKTHIGKRFQNVYENYHVVKMRYEIIRKSYKKSYFSHSVILVKCTETEHSSQGLLFLFFIFLLYQIMELIQKDISTARFVLFP